MGETEGESVVEEEPYEVKMTKEELLMDEIPKNLDSEEPEEAEYRSKHDFFVKFIEKNDENSTSCLIKEKKISYKVINTYLFKVTLIKLVEEIVLEVGKDSPKKRGRRSNFKKNKKFKEYADKYPEKDTIEEQPMSAFYIEANSRTLGVEYKEIILVEELQSIIPDKSQITDENDTNWLDYDNMEKITNSLSKQRRIKRQIKQEMKFGNLVKGLQAKGAGGAFWTKDQVDEYHDVIEKVQIEQTVLIHKTMNFLNRNLDIKVICNSNVQKSEYKVYNIQVFEPTNPQLLYTCSVDFRTLADHAQSSTVQNQDTSFSKSVSSRA